MQLLETAIRIIDVETTKNPFQRVITTGDDEYYHVVLRTIIKYLLTLSMKELEYRYKRVFTYDDSHITVSIIFTKKH